MILARTSCLLIIPILIQPLSSNATELSFNRDVRPILSDHCFQCHGPDQNQIKGGLRLDEASVAEKGGESGPVFDRKQPKSSEFWKRIHETDPDVQMPPPSLGKPLSAKQLTILEQWLQEGANYEGHWAFISPKRPSVPQVQGTTHPIDAFIRERLQAVQLKPNEKASRETLIRRLSLDLIGLPPTTAEVDAFLNDQSPSAYESLVDRLLQSPHFGERLALQWLDFARYADSNGFQTDSSRQMWAWRDWVINAFNKNLPFDQFTIEQLAGDLLPEPKQDQLIATGFNRNTRLNGEGGRIVDEWFTETVIDRVETVGLTWMGLTLNCCRCHDHKYDPISQREFYQLFAIFNSVDESGVLDSDGGNRGGGNSRPVLPLPSPEQSEQLAKLKEEAKQAQDKLEKVRKSSNERQLAWEPGFAAQALEAKDTWKPIQPQEVTSSGGAILSRLEDGTWLASGNNPDFDTYTITTSIEAGDFTAILLEVFPDASLPNQSLGRYPNGNFVLSDVDVEITWEGKSEPLVADFVRAEADYEQKGWPVSAVVNGRPQGKRRSRNDKGWAVDGPTRREPNRAIFVTGSPLTIPTSATMKISLRHQALSGHNIGRFRLSHTGLPGATLSVNGKGLTESLRNALALAAKDRSADQQKEIAKFFQEHADTELKVAEKDVASTKKAIDEFEDKIPTCMIMKERDKPRDAFVLIRGEYDRPGDKVSRGLPAALPKLPDETKLDRLSFARWLVSREHPLTSRVWVNRTWERLFGTGLVKTTENLGSQAEWPSHPELLDWLAVEFMEPSSLPKVAGVEAKPWDIKALIKLFVTSETYQQSSRIPRESWEKDPENRLLSRGPRIRLPAEITRDQALAVSGLLVPTIGGPSVRPYMPAGVWDETSRYGDLRGYREDNGPGLYRRSLYTIWKRTAAPPSMLLFDAPNREVCTVKRSRTNTPLQALTLLNEVTYVEAARGLAQRMLREGGATPEERLKYGFRLATARSPSLSEHQALLEGLHADLERYNKSPDEAKQLTQVGKSPVDTANISELAAYMIAANVLLNLDELVTRE